MSGPVRFTLYLCATCRRFLQNRKVTKCAGLFTKVYTTTLNELENLSNRDLADLGLARSGIKAVALQAAYGN